MRWAEIIASISEDAADVVANIVIEEGCGGAVINGPSVRASGPAELSADLPVPTETTVTCYLPVDDRLEARLGTIRDRIRDLPSTGTNIGPGEITIKWVEDADWAGAWKSFFKPMLIGNVFIKPSWEEIATEDGQIVVEIDPGMAFGTGNHPTTQLCLLALQERIEGGERVLDVGAGSGILAIAAAKLGALEVVGTEIDPVAVKAAKENAERNDVSERVNINEAESLAAVGGGYDIVVANITATTINALAEELAAAVAPDGLLIASGLIESREEEVTKRLEGLGLTRIGRSGDDEWVALVMKRSAESGTYAPHSKVRGT